MDCFCDSKDLFNFGCRCNGHLPLRVWHNGVDWVVAKDAAEATRVLVEHVGYSEEEAEADGWEALPDNKKLSIRDGPDDDSVTVLTAKEWVEEIGEPQVIGSTEY